VSQRYFIAPARRASLIWDDPTRGDTITIHETQREPVKTGLLDKDGREIMRAPEEQPVGFVHHRLGDQK
jgi:hypothetical protein